MKMGIIKKLDEVIVDIDIALFVVSTNHGDLPSGEKVMLKTGLTSAREYLLEYKKIPIRWMNEVITALKENRDSINRAMNVVLSDLLDRREAMK